MSIVPYILKRSKRKSVALVISPQAELVVKVPMRFQVGEIPHLLSKHESWIEIHIARQVAKLKENPKKLFESGELLYFQGEQIEFFLDTTVSRVQLVGGRLYCPSVSLRLRKKLLKQWYADQTAAVTQECLENFKSQVSVFPKSVNVTHASRQWGSCTRDGRVHFSWRLSMAPLAVVEYVVAHELAHLKHHNHSSHFWMEVARLCPEFSLRRAELRKAGHLYTLV